MPPISIVIPCYNQGHFLPDALASLEACDQHLFEVIIVNDGSTDPNTNEYFRKLKNEGKYQVLIQENTGLGQARNNGIALSKGKYILPLDSDNKIRPAFIRKGLEVMENDPQISVLYGNAEWFGAEKKILKPGPFNLQRLLLGNYIDACALIRKSDFEETGGYENMQIMGFEDWDLWLRISFAGKRFYYLDETLYAYRVQPDSMMRTLNANIKRQNEIEDYFLNKYSDKLSFEAVHNHIIYRLKKKPVLFLYRLLLKRFFPAYYERRIRENKMYRGGIYFPF